MSSSERIIIVGGGGFGRELISNVGDCHRAGRVPAIGGYLDDAGDVLAPFGHYDLPWLGRVDDYQPQKGDLITLAIGSSKVKRSVSGKLKVRGARFATIVHPSAIQSPTCRMGEGVIVSTHAGPGVDTRLGDFVTLNSYSGIGHDAVIGDFTTISSHVDITGGARIGMDVYIGSSACILPGVNIGDGANVGAGAVVYRSVRAGATVFAAPAKLLKLSRHSAA